MEFCFKFKLYIKKKIPKPNHLLNNECLLLRQSLRIRFWQIISYYKQHKIIIKMTWYSGWNMECCILCNDYD